MLIERYTGWIVALISLAAAVLYGYQYCAAAAATLAALIPVSLGYITRTKHITKRFALTTLNDSESNLSSVLAASEKRITSQQYIVAELIQAIDKVGNNLLEFKDIRLEGEAAEAIVNLQKKLSVVKEEEEQRIWAAQGIAQISEIRKDNATLEDYAFYIISHLVKFLKANQGVLYVKNDEEEKLPYLELLATYAYGKRKYTAEKITLEYGTGLVGQCALEGSMILLTDIPADYVKITSGLGEALPRCLTLTPLIFRGEVFGVIEIASFQKFATYQLEFIQKASETIGLELSGIRAQERTRKILEQSREEELRQNLEEMKAAQREMVIKEEELSNQLAHTQRAMAMADAERKKNEAILEGCMDAVISFTQNGTIEYFNKAAEEIFGISRDELINRNVNMILNIHIMEHGDGDFRILNAAGNEVTLRTEINASDSKGEDISLLLTATKVKIDKKYLFTLFAQKVSVELF